MADSLAWLTKYEAVAVWLEGIALVAIFIWERIDAHGNHKETIKQIKLAQDQITAVQNAERAWVMTELEWPKSEHLKIVLTSSRHGQEPQVDQTTVTVMLHCNNEGRSPAFVDKIQAYGEIVDSVDDLSFPRGHQAQKVIPFGPLAPGKSSVRTIELTSAGHIRDDQIFSIFVLVEYRDIFNHERLTTCGYSVYDHNLYRQDTIPERNRFT